MSTASAEDKLVETDSRDFRDLHFKIVYTDSAIHNNVVLVDVKLGI